MPQQLSPTFLFNFFAYFDDFFKVLVNFWHSEVMEDVWNELGTFATCLYHHGLTDICLDDYLERLDLDGECEAYDAMELHWCDYGETYRPNAPASVLLKIIKSQYRKLALQFVTAVP